ncbi:MAG: hypothetical protein KatS3mg121_1516 [Gammaproteobacteria bacterium]|nr:MAG: hypothetical protein KatS3mg121_1516 [Gammaproteobacteria bacterium]
MSRLVLVVEQRRDWAEYFPSEDVCTVEEYLERGAAFDGAVEVINLCRSYRYLGAGYYCSLLAEARGHRVVPSVRTLHALSRKSIYSLDFESLDAAVRKAFGGETGEARQAEIMVYFGQTEVEAMRPLAQQIYERFPCPILKVGFRFTGGAWRIDQVRPVGLHSLRGAQQDAFAEALDRFSRKIWRKPRARRRYRYDLAILHDPNEKLPPSNAGALRRFVAAGRRLGMDVELIRADAYPRLAEYDALFIRETTALDHHTYRFAQRAEREGLVVIDDPLSIQRCTNKIYLFERLTAAGVPVPRTKVVFRDRPDAAAVLIEALGLPMVLKVPDGSFSRGVVRVDDEAALERALAGLFRQSVLVLAQEYVYTDFDWRIGVLNRRPLFACRYYMARGHWQIYQHGAGTVKGGGFDCLPVEAVPAAVRRAAVKAANSIGDGLYGVDLKARDGRVMVIEVNDNPNIDAGVEDAYLGKRLYEAVMGEFLRRIEQRA